MGAGWAVVTTADKRDLCGKPSSCSQSAPARHPVSFERAGPCNRSPSLTSTLPSPTYADARVDENARVPAYTVNEDAVRHAKALIDARQYVLRSR